MPRHRPTRGPGAGLLLVALCATVAGCPNEELAPLTPCTVLGVKKEVKLARTDKVDVLFVVDNSGSMAEEQASLARELPRLVQVITSGDVDQDGTREFEPVQSLHLGVISTNMGSSGASGVPGGCLDVGDDGLLQSSGLSQQPQCAGQTVPRFLSFSAGDDPADVGQRFGCLSELGTAGCGFEQPLEAALKALTPAAWPSSTSGTCTPGSGLCPGSCGDPATLCTFGGRSPAGHGDGANGGFLQEDSLVLVVLVTDEDDCSIPDVSADLFSLNGGAFHGEPPNLRCYDQPQALHPLSRYLRGLRSLRPQNPDLVVFAAITGVPEALAQSGATAAEMLADPALGYDVDCRPFSQQRSCFRDPTCRAGCLQAAGGRPGGLLPWPSCTATGADGEDRGRAYPPRRILELAESFGDAGVVQSICQEDFGPALDVVIDKLLPLLGGGCLPTRFNPDQDGLIQCDVVETVPAAVGCQRPGRSLAESTSAPDGNVRCLVDQVAVARDEVSSLREDPAERLLPNPFSGATSGWYYDDFSAGVKERCASTGDVQKISLTGDARQHAQSVLTIECFSQAVSVAARNQDALGVLSCASQSCEAYAQSPSPPLAGSEEARQDAAKPFQRAWLYGRSDLELQSMPPEQRNPRRQLVCETRSRTCMQACTRDADCPNGWVCDGAGPEAVCVPPTCPPLR